MKNSSVDRSNHNSTTAQQSNNKELPDILPKEIQNRGMKNQNNSSHHQDHESGKQSQVVTNFHPKNHSYSGAQKQQNNGVQGGSLPQQNINQFLANHHGSQNGQNSRHSNLRNQKGKQIGNSKGLSTSPVKHGKNGAHHQGNLQIINDNKYVKPSELNLDLIMPSSIRNKQAANNMLPTGANGPQTTNNANVSNILSNLRTPQNQPNQLLQPLQMQQIKKKELVNMLSMHDQSLQNLQQSLNMYKSQNHQGGAHQKRNSNAGRVAIGQIQHVNMNQQSHNKSSNNSNSPPQLRQTGLQQNSNMIPSVVQPSSTKNRNNPLQSNYIVQGGAHHQRGNSHDDRLNHSVDINGKKLQNAIKVSQHGKHAANSQQRDNGMRVSRHHHDDAKMNNSVHDFSGVKAHQDLDMLNSTGQGIKDDSTLVNKRGKVLSGNKDNENHNKSVQQQEEHQQSQSGEAHKLSKDLQFNLQNLTKIDEKLTSLTECLKRSNINNVSQLCSDWWELTDEDDYTINKFMHAYKDEKVKRELKLQMCLEILSIAVVNYFTSSPVIFKPTTMQVTQVKNLLSQVHQNFILVVEFIITKLPQESLQSQYATQLQSAIKQRKKKNRKQENQAQSIRQMNESISVLLKSITRQSAQLANQRSGGQNMSAKKMIQLRNQGLIKNQQLLSGQALKPLFLSINESQKNIETLKVNQVRDSIIKASEKIEDLKLLAQQVLPPLYGVGGTAIGGYEALPPVEPPYLPAAKNPNGYCLVLDLDETLVHYYEHNGEGSFRIRPGCDKFLKEMAELYEVVIFTAAMQDYADWVLDQIDKEKRISYRMYRQHASPTGHVFVKDLSRIGRDLSKTIIVDNVAENFSLQPDNGIFIKSWFEDPTDTALLELAPLLKQIVKKNVSDVREALRKFRDQMLEQIQKGVTNPQLSLD